MCWFDFCTSGTDPATDLRGTGFLGLMHTLYFVMDPETLPLARDIYKLSQHPTQVAPLQFTPCMHVFDLLETLVYVHFGQPIENSDFTNPSERH